MNNDNYRGRHHPTGGQTEMVADARLARRPRADTPVLRGAKSDSGSGSRASHNPHLVCLVGQLGDDDERLGGAAAAAAAAALLLLAATAAAAAAAVLDVHLGTHQDAALWGGRHVERSISTGRGERAPPPSSLRVFARRGTPLRLQGKRRCLPAAGRSAPDAHRLVLTLPSSYACRTASDMMISPPAEGGEARMDGSCGKANDRCSTGSPRCPTGSPTGQSGECMRCAVHTSSWPVCVFDPRLVSVPRCHRTRGEVWRGDVTHELARRDVGVGYERFEPGHHLAHVVRGDLQGWGAVHELSAKAWERAACTRADRSGRPACHAPAALQRPSQLRALQPRRPTLVAMPTAMPEEPLIRRLGRREGSTVGSSWRPGQQ